LIDHAPEGQTDKVSALRGHPVEAAAKCIVLIVKVGRKTSRFVLAVVPGNARVDTTRVRSLFNGATYAGFAATDVAERLAGSVAGTVLPFAFHPDLTLIADPSITTRKNCSSTPPAWKDRWRFACPTTLLSQSPGSRESQLPDHDRPKRMSSDLPCFRSLRAGVSSCMSTCPSPAATTGSPSCSPPSSSCRWPAAHW
jgi:prolyl-tRNA editing enzyme YbaK/EbsC (Cys-tRNA(Pro) deacylase)